MILNIIAALVLFAISVIILIILFRIVQLYSVIGEPVIFHFAFIGLMLVLTFVSGGLGVFFELDQQQHVIFDLNLLFLSLTHVAFGFIYREFHSQHTLLGDYLLLVLGFAPAFALALIVGAPFVPAVAIASQLIPLLVIITMEVKLIGLTSNAKLLDAEKRVAHILNRIFSSALIIHLLGIIAMIVFAVLFSIGNTTSIEEIWIGEWQLFDYLYLMAALVILASFLLILRNMSRLRALVMESRMDLVVNSILV